MLYIQPYLYISDYSSPGDPTYRLYVDIPQSGRLAADHSGKRPLIIAAVWPLTIAAVGPLIIAAVGPLFIAAYEPLSAP